MTALNLYVSACRLVLQANAEDQNSWTELYRMLPFLRQALSCSVCNALSVEPVLPMDAKCQHHICRKCVGGKHNKARSLCEWCNDCDTYTESVQLRLLLQCYKRLCLYLTTTSFFRKLGSVNANGGTTSLADMIQEGCELRDEYRYTSVPRSSVPTSSSQNQPSQLNQTVNNGNCNNTVLEKVDNNSSILSKNSTSQVILNETTLPTVLTNGNSILTGPPSTLPPKPEMQTVLVAVTSTSNCNSHLLTDVLASTDMSDPEITFKEPRLTITTPSPSISDVLAKSKKLPPRVGRKKRRGCRCGNASPCPGKLTCCGQRCPCYVSGKGCLECNCKGCRNPKKYVPAETAPIPQCPILNTITFSHMDLSTVGKLIGNDFEQDTFSTDEGSDIDIDV